MEELTPIRQIKANFGEPMAVPIPKPYSIWELIRDEALKCDDDPYDVFMADSYVWEASITPEQKKTFDELNAKCEEAEKAYDSKVHGESSPQARAFREAEKARENFVSSTGKHLCYRCSYYDADVIGKTETLEGVFTPFCTRKGQNELVRPYCIACPHFTTDFTPEMIKEAKEYQEACRNNPGFASYVKKRQRENTANRFAEHIKTDPSTAFYLYKDNPAKYESLYDSFPYIFAETQYPSYPLFLEAFKRWEKDVIIKKTKDELGRESITLSVSQEEFCPKSLLAKKKAETSYK